MKRFFIGLLANRYDDLAALVLRVSFGMLMIPHAAFKYRNFDNIEGEFMSFLGLGSHTTLWMVITIEFVCSLLLIIGLMTRLANLPLFVTSIVIVFVAHQGDILGEGAGGFFYLLAYSAILLLGPGKYSVDRLIVKRLSGRSVDVN